MSAEDKDFIEAQTRVVITQSKKINELERKLEIAEVKLAKAEQSSTISTSLNKDQTGGSNSDGETICLIQLALLRAAAMLGELTLEECKKVEIYVKTLQIIKGKTEDKKIKEAGKNLSNEELIALMNTELEQ